MSDPAPPLPRAAVLGLAALTVLAVCVLSLSLFWSDLVSDPGGDSSDATSTTSVSEGDDFDRTDAVGLADADHGWQEHRGTWAVQDQHAAITTGDTGPVAGLPTLPMPSGVRRLEVTATAVEPGWGVAFRVQDPDDLWAVVARPDRGTWSLVHLDAGAIQETQDFLAAEPTDGNVLQVELIDDLIRVSVDGRVSSEVREPALAGATDVGLLALPGGSLASMAWDSLTLSGP